VAELAPWLPIVHLLRSQALCHMLDDAVQISDKVPSTNERDSAIVRRNNAELSYVMIITDFCGVESGTLRFMLAYR
jgi:hypothetical protein